jgi:hypothetical protein
LLPPFANAGYLPDCDIAFTYRSATRKGGVLDLKTRPGQLVPGVIFDVQGDGWNALDHKEGAPHIYERISRVAIDDRGEQVPVMTYRVRPERAASFVQPNAAYLRVVRDGLDEFGLPGEGVLTAAKRETTPWLVDAFFVYGTLLRGESRFPIMKTFGLTCTLMAQTFGRLVDLGSFPGLIDLSESTRMVRGDFIRVQRPAEAIREHMTATGFPTPTFSTESRAFADLGSRNPCIDGL